jgi:hypothetical protein
LLLNARFIAVRHIIVALLITGLIWREHPALYSSYQGVDAVLLV